MSERLSGLMRVKVLVSLNQVTKIILYTSVLFKVTVSKLFQKARMYSLKPVKDRKGYRLKILKLFNTTND